MLKGKLNLFTKNGNKNEVNGVKVTLFEKVTNNINTGNKSNYVAGISAIITALAYLLAWKFPESKISKLLMDNAMEIAGVVLAVCSYLVAGVKK